MKLLSDQTEDILSNRLPAVDFDLRTLSENGGIFFSEMILRWDESLSASANSLKLISSGQHGGLQCQLLFPEQWRGSIAPFHILQVLFKPGYYLYDCRREEHKALAITWESENGGEDNIWSDSGMASRIRQENCRCVPNHQRFFEENKFGAYVRRTEVGPFIMVVDENAIADWTHLKTTYDFPSTFKE